ncbi:MAG TPA: hypothetical protein VFV03_00180, partial [Solirubrobacteraceae bacterium]|nr:hypothetical protein [Solirubrobacteraceae bacterium]
DDGGCTHTPSATDWGTGLTEADAELRALGGCLSLRSTGTGLELSASVPANATAADAFAAYTSVPRRIDQLLARCTPMMRSVTWFQSTTCLLTARRARSAVAHALLFSGLVAIDRVWYRRAADDRRRAATMLPAIGLLWPAGGRPATGWPGLELVAQGARGRSDIAALTGLAFVATAASARRVRGSLERGRLVENVAFPVVCALTGLAAAAVRRSLARAEREVLGLRERAELIERLAGAVKLRHAVIEPLRGTEGWWERGIMESAEGQRLLSLSERIDVLTAELLGLIAVPDPVRDIVDHLRLRLDPVTVGVRGDWPASAPRSEREPALKRAREQLAATALAEELANQLVARFPPTLAGRSRLQSVHLDIDPLGEHELRVTVRPLSDDGTPGQYDLVRLKATLASMSGRLLTVFDAGGFGFAVPTAVLVAR